MSGRPLVVLKNVSFGWGAGEFRLEVASLEIERGERVACIGPSGTGKTTLIHLVAGILVPSEGRVHLGEIEVSALSDDHRRAERIRRVGLVFQEFELLDYLSALENILLPYLVNASLELTDEVRTRASRLAETCGIGHVVRRSPRRLSHGERQRVAICRALVAEPELLLCDEPTGNLDPETADGTLDLLFEQVARHDATLLMVTHNHAILDRFDRVVDVRELSP